MEIGKLNSLVELYFKKCEEVEDKKPFLKWLKPEKPTYTWGDIKQRVYKLSHKIKSLINEGDRCLILSENRPYWLMVDLAVMNAGGISVPIFTTYSLNDYEYIDYGMHRSYNKKTQNITFDLTNSEIKTAMAHQVVGCGCVPKPGNQENEKSKSRSFLIEE